MACAVAIFEPLTSVVAAAATATVSDGKPPLHLGPIARLGYANAAALALLLPATASAAPGTAPAEAANATLMRLPDCAAAAEVSAVASCVVAEAAIWWPWPEHGAGATPSRSGSDGGNGTTDGSAGPGSSGGGLSSSSASDASSICGGRGGPGRGVGSSGSSSGSQVPAGLGSTVGACGCSVPDALRVDRLVVCPITAPNDAPVGLALLFDAWSWPADGALGRPGFPRVLPGLLPRAPELQAASEDVRQQADYVRGLKQGRRLSNQHPEVQAAVEELQRRKEQLAVLDGLAAAFAPDRSSPLDLWAPRQ